MRLAFVFGRPMRALSIAVVGLLLLGPALAAAAQAEEAEALEDLLTHEVVLEQDGEPVVRVRQRLELDGCDAVVTTTHHAPGTDRRRMLERARFRIGRMQPAGEGEAGSDSALEMTARDYFVRAGDPGLSRWLAALAATRGAPDRAAEMRKLQMRVDRGEFGRFARRNGYEMRSFLEGDPEPYYAMPLPTVALRLPEGAAAKARAGWWRYAERHCPR